MSPGPVLRGARCGWDSCALRPGRRVGLERRRATRFVTAPADDFQGWAGQQTWSNNHPRIDASYHRGGHVALRRTLRLWFARIESWSASVTNWIQAMRG
ncbi:DUF6228 family protein [Hamadaea sp. NPDC051192]|uniref:DUF6228 family protein n=1 Tax=Hamadaea sp. NPDC051192 TaxID=3154940 RepID=UPI00344600CA